MHRFSILVCRCRSTPARMFHPFAQSLSQPHIMSKLYKKFHILTFISFIQTGKGDELSGKNAFNLGTSTDDPRINFEIEISQQVQVHLQSAPNFAQTYIMYCTMVSLILKSVTSGLLTKNLNRYNLSMDTYPFHIHDTLAQISHSFLRIIVYL